MKKNLLNLLVVSAVTLSFTSCSYFKKPSHNKASTLTKEQAADAKYKEAKAKRKNKQAKKSEIK